MPGKMHHLVCHIAASDGQRADRYMNAIRMWISYDVNFSIRIKGSQPFDGMSQNIYFVLRFAVGIDVFHWNKNTYFYI